MGDGKKSLFLLYLEANSISLGADITQFVAPDARYAPGAMPRHDRGCHAWTDIWQPSLPGILYWPDIYTCQLLLCVRAENVMPFHRACGSYGNT